MWNWNPLFQTFRWSYSHVWSAVMWFVQPLYRCVAQILWAAKSRKCFKIEKETYKVTICKRKRHYHKCILSIAVFAYYSIFKKMYRRKQNISSVRYIVSFQVTFSHKIDPMLTVGAGWFDKPKFSPTTVSSVPPSVGPLIGVTCQ